MNSSNEQHAQTLREGAVSAVESQQKDPTRVSVYVDGEFAFCVSGEIAAAEGIRVGRTLSLADQERIVAAEEMASARHVALVYLSRRARTSTEVRTKLERSGFGARAVEAAMQRLTELGYLDDCDYAHRYADARFGRRYGPRRIVQELKRRGIAPALAEQAVNAARDAVGVHAQARTLAENRAARLQGETDLRKRKKKVYDFLIRRGYDSDVAWTVVNALQESEWT